MTLTITVTGTEKLKTTLKRLTGPYLDRVGSQSVKTLEKHLKRTYERKVDTGRLKKSIKSIWDSKKRIGIVTLGDNSTVREMSKGSPSANYAKFIEEGFESHFFPMSTTHKDSKFYSTDAPYGHVSGYAGLQGMPKAIEKTRKEMTSIANEAFKKEIAK